MAELLRLRSSSSSYWFVWPGALNKFSYVILRDMSVSDAFVLFSYILIYYTLEFVKVLKYTDFMLILISASCLSQGEKLESSLEKSFATINIC